MTNNATPDTENTERTTREPRDLTGWYILAVGYFGVAVYAAALYLT